jgi:hypothetical protein
MRSYLFLKISEASKLQRMIALPAPDSTSAASNDIRDS